jgi:hypothetical protein
MSFFTSGMFWFIEGILFTLAVMGFKVWMEDRGNPMPFWKWMLVGVWVLVLGFTIAFVGTNIGEGELTAALKGGILFGLVTVIGAAGLWRLLSFGRQKES